MRAKLTKRAIKAVLLHLPGGKAVLKVIKRYRFQRDVGRFQNSRELFTSYYGANRWDSHESASGPGSTEEYTRSVRDGIAAVIERLGVRRILDAPCGDYNWFRLVQRGPEVQYLGGDIVEPLIARNQERFTNATTRFMQLDITQTPLPQADLWLCRDVLFHFSEDDVYRALRNFLGAGIPYLLTTSYTLCRHNSDIPTGSFRELNLELPPFNFPRADLYIKDWIEGYAERYLCLWTREAIAGVLGRNEHS